MLISVLMLVMLTSLAGYPNASGARGGSDAELQPVEKTAPRILAETKDLRSKAEDGVMSKRRESTVRWGMDQRRYP